MHREPNLSPPRPRTLHLTRDQVRGRLRIPSRHFLDRDFSPSILDAFNVGDSAKLSKALVPLYDDEGEFCIGYTVRSCKPPCGACRKHHDPGVPCKWGQKKWGIMEGFPKRTYLYNYAAARRTASLFVFLVEGPPDVWRLAEAGYVGVALLGSDATDEQLRKLAALDKQILIAFDSDAAGEAARERFLRRRVQFPWTFFVTPGRYKDIGDVPVEELRRSIHSFNISPTKGETENA